MIFCPLSGTVPIKNMTAAWAQGLKGGSRLEGYSTFRTFGNRVYNVLFSIATGRKISDLGSGLNLYDSRILRDKFFLKFPDNLTFNYCMILAAAHYGHTALFFPIIWREEDQVSNVKLMNQAAYVLKMVIKYFFLRGRFIKNRVQRGIKTGLYGKNHI